MKTLKKNGRFFECDTPLEVQNTILDMRSKKNVINEAVDFASFRRTQNSQKYAQIITGVKQ